MPVFLPSVLSSAASSGSDRLWDSQNVPLLFFLNLLLFLTMFGSIFTENLRPISRQHISALNDPLKPSPVSRCFTADVAASNHNFFLLVILVQVDRSFIIFRTVLVL